MHERAAHVRPVADERHPNITELLARRHVFSHRDDIGYDLGGMVVIGEPVNHRHVRVGGEVGDGLVLERAAHEHVDHAREDLRGVVERLASAEMDLARLEIERVAAEVRHRRLERNASSRGRFLEDHAEVGVGKQFRGVPPLVGRFQKHRQIHDVGELLPGEILRVNEVSELCHILAPRT